MSDETLLGLLIEYWVTRQTVIVCDIEGDYEAADVAAKVCSVLNDRIEPEMRRRGHYTGRTLPEAWSK